MHSTYYIEYKSIMVKQDPKHIKYCASRCPVLIFYYNLFFCVIYIYLLFVWFINEYRIW